MDPASVVPYPATVTFLLSRLRAAAGSTAGGFFLMLAAVLSTMIAMSLSSVLGLYAGCLVAFCGRWQARNGRG